MRDYTDRRVSLPERVSSPTGGIPFPCPSQAQELNFLQLSVICILRSRPCHSVRSKIPMFSYFVLWLPLVRLKIERDNNFLKNWFLLKRGRRDSHTKNTGILVGN